MMQPKNELVRIAVVGIGGIFPGARNATEFWKNIIKGKDLITEIPPDHWNIADYYDKDPKAIDKTYCRRGAFLPHVEFDPIEWGMPPQNIISTDTSQLLALIAAKEVLQDTFNGRFFGVDLSRASVILGTTCMLELIIPVSNRQSRPLWAKAMKEHGLDETQIKEICDRICEYLPPWTENTFPGLLMNVVAGRIANRLNFGGTNCTTDAACASSLAALSMGINELRVNQSDLVVIGGVDTLNDINTYMCFSKTPALSPSEECSPFSAKSDGTLLGEGLGLLALKRLDDAEKDGNHIYAVIRGIGTSSDGRSKSIYAPLAEGQAVALKNAYAMAAYPPDTVELVEAHGTGTKAGDIEEFKSLKSVFETAQSQKKQWCALGSIKSQIGHTKGAAGAASLFKIVMALHHKVLPPTLKVEQPNPNLNIESSPFYLNTSAKPWIKDDTLPRRASVSSFGFGGTNFHITVEEYEGSGKKALRTNSADRHLFLLSADTVQNLLTDCRTMVEESKIFDEAYAPYRARQSYQNFSHQKNYRAAILAKNNDDLREKLYNVIQQLEKNAETSLTRDDIYYCSGLSSGKIAFIFSGQGSQYLNMGADIAMNFDSSRKIWDKTTKIPLDKNKFLHEVVYPKPAFSIEEKKKQEEFINSTIWSQPAIAAMAYSQIALLQELNIKPDCVAGHSLGELVALAYAGLYDFETLIKIAHTRGELMAQSDETLPGTAVNEFRTYLETIPFNSLNVSVYSNLYVKQHQIEEVKNTIANSLSSSDRFTEMILSMYADGVRTFIEIGPDATLSRLTPTILTGKNIQSIAVDHKNEHGVISLLRALGQLAALGVPFEIDRLFSAFVMPPEPEALANKKHKILINGANVKPIVSPLKKTTNQAKQESSDTPLSKLAIQGKARQITENKIHKPNDSSTESMKEFLTSQRPNRNHEIEHPVQHNTSTINETQRGTPMNDTDKKHSPLISLLEDIQENITREYEIYQKSTAESHRAYLQLMEQTLQQIHQYKEGGSIPNFLPISKQNTDIPIEKESLVKVNEPIQPISTFNTSKKEPEINISAESKPYNEPKSNEGLDQLADALLNIIAQETGYPKEMLRLDMEMEADLGIDSIKRVEILSAIKEQISNLPELDPMPLVTLKTLEELKNYLANQSQAEQKVEISGEMEYSSPEPVPELVPTLDITHEILAIIAEETGYPKDMLKWDMEMEADLGIDSIKRVEIFSAIKEKIPNSHELDPMQLATLKTLEQLKNYLEELQPKEVAAQ